MPEPANYANLLSASRLLLLAPLAAWFILQQQWQAALLVWLVAVFSDLADGWLARRLQSTSALGGLLDHGADACFVFFSMLALSLQGLITLWLAPLVALAFIRYITKHRLWAGGNLKTSHLGKANGVAYYLLCGFAIIQSELGWPNQQMVQISAWLLVASTALLLISGFRRT